MFAIAYVVLWAVYGFRYWPRPGHAPMTLALDQFLQQVREQGTHGVIVDHIIPALARWHLAPLAYLYGFVDVLSISHPRTAAIPVGHSLSTRTMVLFPDCVRY